MINTSTAAFVLEAGSQQKFDGSSIICEPTYFELQSKFGVRLVVVDSLTTTTIAYGYMELTVTEVEAETGTGLGETAPWWSGLQRAVSTKLAAIADNSSVVFTVI